MLVADGKTPMQLYNELQPLAMLDIHHKYCASSSSDLIQFICLFGGHLRLPRGPASGSAQEFLWKCLDDHLWCQALNPDHPHGKTINILWLLSEPLCLKSTIGLPFCIPSGTSLHPLISFTLLYVAYREYIQSLSRVLERKLSN